MDKSDSEQLILHFDKETGEVRLAIHVPGTMVRWLKHPFGKVGEFKDVSEKEIRFGPDGLLINGENYPISVESVNYNEGPF